MAGTFWDYFVPYQEDIDKALQDLREQVFQMGQYRKWPHVQAETIEGVVAESGESGTHSILDIKRISPFPALQAVSPLSAERLQEVFGSDKPTRRMVMVEDMIEDDELEELNPRWQGIYIVIYKRNKPDLICFVGSSGD